MINTKQPADIAYKVMAKNHKGGGMLPNSAGYTVEAVFQDWSLSQMAEKPGKKKRCCLFT